ncbi:fungal-specific transcription factor domain-containing protein [Nemania serpens]|nr:fungal-specific transcription factor domain-containing protein [Nemania serpens]
MARPPKLPRIGGDWTYPGVEHRHLDPYIDRTFGSQEYLQQQSAPTSTSTSNTHWQVPTNEEERGDNNGYDDGDGKKDDGDNRDDDEDEDEDEGPTNPWLSDEHFLNILPHDSDNVAAVQGSFVAEHRKRGFYDAFHDDLSTPTFFPHTYRHFPDYIPQIPPAESRKEEHDALANPFAAEDGRCIHPALRRERQPVTIAKIVELNGFLRARFHVRPPEVQGKLTQITFLPQRLFTPRCHQPTLPPLPEVGHLGSAGPSSSHPELAPRLPPGFGDVRHVKVVDRKLFGFFTNAVCQGRTVIPSDNTYLKQIVPMAEKNALVRHCILAVAASYVLDWYFNAEIEQRANYHFAKALALLNDELKNCDFHIPGNGETLVASIILFCHIENINWDHGGPKETFPKWYKGTSLAERILDTSNPAIKYRHSLNVQFTPARAQLANRICIDSVFSDCVFSLDPNPGKCRYLWLNHGNHRDKRKIIGFTGLSPELMHHLVKITHLSARRHRRPGSEVIPPVGHEIEDVLENFWQWSDLSDGYATSQELFDSCELDEHGKVNTAAKVTELVGESYACAAQIYLQCRLFRRTRTHPRTQSALERLLKTIERQPVDGPLFTAQTPLFSVFIASTVAWRVEDRARIRAWFDPICVGARGNVPPIYDCVKHIWNWLDEYENTISLTQIEADLSREEQYDDTETQAQGAIPTSQLRQEDAVALDNSDAWWEMMVEEVVSNFGRINLS